nr:competence protein ComK [uncultured Bacillus sp.]
MELVKGSHEYMINEWTMMIQPVQYNDKLYSRILQLDGEFYSPYKPKTIIVKNCLDNLSDFNGRIKASKHILGISKKVPIVISSENRMFFFPTASPDDADCCWINPIHYEKIQVLDKKNILVVFKNKQIAKISISEYTFNNQVNKTVRLQTHTLEKQRENEGRLYFLYQNNMRVSEKGSGRNILESDKEF